MPSKMIFPESLVCNPASVRIFYNSRTKDMLTLNKFNRSDYYIMINNPNLMMKCNKAWFLCDK